MGGSVGAAVGASVGASVATGASVAAGPQALRTNEAITNIANTRNEKRLFIISPLKRIMGFNGAFAPVIKMIIQNLHQDKYISQ
jgi:hypothetical protein